MCLFLPEEEYAQVVHAVVWYQLKDAPREAHIQFDSTTAIHAKKLQFKQKRLKNKIPFLIQKK